MAKRWTARARRWWFAQQMKGKKGKGGGADDAAIRGAITAIERRKKAAPHLREAQAIGQAENIRTRISALPFRHPLMKDGIAAYNSENKTIYLNPNHPHWENPGEYMSFTHEQRLYSLNHPHHAIYHEIGHALHDRFSPDSYQRQRRESWSEQHQHLIPVSSKVSRYATQKSLEFVAETYAARRSGIRLDTDVMKAYNELGGPP